MTNDFAHGLQKSSQAFWFGIMAMKQLAIKEGMTQKEGMEVCGVVNKIKKGFTDVEVEKTHQVSNMIAFPHMKQTLYPLVRQDEKKEHHFNLIQLPIGTKIDLNSGLSTCHHF